VLGFMVFLITACGGSDAYQGTWKATDGDGSKFEITFDSKKFDVKDSLGKIEKYDYSQNSVNIENSVKTYGIKLSDGRGYQINFPNANNDAVGLIKDENGDPIYVISRQSYMSYDDIFKLK
jgi:hypothetical protein